MAVGSYLIHSGLPWTSPQKIIISSAEYINNIVINRGLLNLLNNDYYLDLKTEALNNYIQQNLGQHLADTSIHVSWSRINALFSDINIAVKDAIYYIPVTWNGKSSNIEHSEIQNILNLIPKNLNGHTIVLYFCHGYNDDQYKTVTEDDDEFTKSFEHNSLLFSNFSSGDLVIYSNPNMHVKLDNYTDLTSLEVKEAYANVLFDEIQTKLNDQSKFDAASGFTFKSTGLNKDYSVFAIKNCQANVYLVNVKLVNNINWNNLANEVTKIQRLPAENDLLNFYPMTTISNNKILNKQAYLNTSYLYKANDYSLYYNADSPESISASFTFEGKNVTCLKLNTENISNSPQYLSFDDSASLSSYIISDELRNYIYNWDGNSPSFSILFLGKLANNLSNYSNCPIFCDYNVSNNSDDYGLYVYLNKLYRTGDSTDIAEYQTNFETHYTALSETDAWGMYVVEFIHDINEIPPSSTVDSSHFTATPINNGKMRVNLAFYPFPSPYDTNTCKNVEPLVLIPNNTTSAMVAAKATVAEKQAYLRQVNYEFTPLDQDHFDTLSYPIRLFANKRKNNTSSSIKDWDYFTGHVSNMFLFRKILTKREIQSLLAKNFASSFNWMSDSEKQIIDSISTSSYLGSLYLYNNQNINIIGCNINNN